MTKPDQWSALKQYTGARIALGRTGASQPTREILRFGLAHARARDAVHAPFDSDTLACQLEAMGLNTLTVHSAAADRHQYLCRPDLGRQLDEPSRHLLRAAASAAVDLVIVVGDGLSSYAVQRQAAPMIAALLPWLEQLGLTLGPVVLAHQSRVALGDDAGFCLNARAVAVLIGERPGLSSPDSLGVYMTRTPHPQRLDADRNCISNIRPEGLSYDAAAFKLGWLLEQSFLRRLSGVKLKDESDNPAIGGTIRATRPYPDRVSLS